MIKGHRFNTAKPCEHIDSSYDSYCFYIFRILRFSRSYRYTFIYCSANSAFRHITQTFVILLLLLRIPRFKCTLHCRTNESLSFVEETINNGWPVHSYRRSHALATKTAGYYIRKSFVFDTPGVPFLIDLQAPQILVSFLIHLRQSHVFANTQKIPVMWVAQF